MRKGVCFIAHEIPLPRMPFKAGQSSLFINLIECIKKQLTVSLVSTHRPKFYDVIMNNHKALAECREVLEGICLMPSSKNRDMSSFYLLRGLIKLSNLLNIDIIHMVGVNPLIFPLLCKLNSRTRNMKLIAHFYMLPSRRAIPIDRLTKRMSLIDAFAITTPLLRHYILNLGIGDEKVFLIPPPINCKVFKPLDEYKVCKKRSVECKNTILYMGGLASSRFPINNIVGALKLLKNDGFNIQMLIIARGISDYHKIETINKKAKKLGLSKNIKTEVRLLSMEEKVRLFNTIDLAIFPFTDFVAVDPPITLLEVMSCGKVAISTKVQSVPQVIKDGFNGFLLESPTPTQLYQTIRRALTFNNLIYIQRNARRTVLEGFSYDEVVKKLIHMYNEVSSS